jgi:hypothetical protein
LGSTPVRAAALSKKIADALSDTHFFAGPLLRIGKRMLGGCHSANGGIVLSVKEDVFCGMAEKNNFQPVTRESRIPDGSLVRTSDRALLDLGLIAGALAQLSSNSEITIEELKISKDGNQTRGGMRSRGARAPRNQGKFA